MNARVYKLVLTYLNSFDIFSNLGAAGGAAAGAAGAGRDCKSVPKENCEQVAVPNCRQIAEEQVQ